MLELSHIDKYYNPGSVNEMCLFQDFNLTIPNSQFVSVVGSNGSGKTSMLNLICGSISADAGKVIVNGTDITGQKEYMRHRKIGRVYQNPSAGTCPNMTVLENMAVADLKEKGYGLNRCVRKSRENAYREMLSGLGLGLEDKLETKVGSLSVADRSKYELLFACTNSLQRKRILIYLAKISFIPIPRRDIRHPSSRLSPKTGTMIAL
jgi:putative tryptophan/tyrosine transport system ATP-binding protein